MIKIRNGFYRVSTKALILDETKKFLIIQDEEGWWDLPGGGLEWHATPQTNISREVKEEMGLTVSKVATEPSYFYTYQKPGVGLWFAAILYETEVTNLSVTKSDECVDWRFVDKENLPASKVFPSILQLASEFNA